VVEFRGSRWWRLVLRGPVQVPRAEKVWVEGVFAGSVTEASDKAFSATLIVLQGSDAVQDVDTEGCSQSM